MGFFDFLFGKKESPNQNKTIHKETSERQSETNAQSGAYSSQSKSTAGEDRTSTPSSKSVGNTLSLANIIGRYFSLDQLRQIPMGQVRLQPLDGRLAMDPSSQQMVAVMAQTTPDIKKYLPNLDLSSAKSIGRYFLNYCSKTELGYEFGYAIKTGDDGYLGFIFVHTPEMNEKVINFPKWSTDFCLFKPFQGQGIMTQTLSRVLYLLKTEMKVSEVYAYVDEENESCLKMLSRLPFDLQPETLTDPITGHKALLFCCPLHEINFQRR